jgi:hypothetical protein
VLTLGIAGLIAAYVVIALLLLSVNLYSNWSWPVKAATIIVTSTFYVVTYYSIPGLLGWPTPEHLPAKFKLNAVHVIQPDKLNGGKGAIFLWVTELRDLKPTGMPRAYSLPYSDPLYEKVNKASIKMNKGLQQLGEYKEPDSDVEIIVNPGRTGQVSTPVKFYDLPDPLYPEK